MQAGRILSHGGAVDGFSGARLAPASGDPTMQRITFVRYAAKPDRADENEALSRAVFAELRAKRPPGIAYALCRAGDNFVHMFINFAGDESESLTDLASFRIFSAEAPERQAAPPELVRMSVDVIEAYGFERATAPA
jgi:hypothetical protein